MFKIIVYLTKNDYFKHQQGRCDHSGNKNKHMKRNQYIAMIITLAVLAGCGSKEKGQDSTVTATEEGAGNGVHVTKAQFDGAKMTLVGIDSMTFPDAISVNGMVDVPPENRVLVAVPWGGYVKRAPLLVGDKVKKGQLLVTLENPEFITLQQQFLETGDQLAYLKSEYDRQRTLYDEKISSQKNYLKSESDYKTALSRHSAMAKQLTLLNIAPSQVRHDNIVTTATIYSPISGSVTQVNITKGAFVSPASPLMEIIDTDHIHVELSVFEKDIVKVEKGQLIRFRIPEVSQEVYDGEVHLVGTSIGPNRMVKVHGHLKDEEGHGFLTGMFVEAQIITGTSKVMALPSEAVSTVEEIPYVLHLTGDDRDGYDFERIPMQTGSTQDDHTEILNASDFKPTDRFLGKGAFDLIGH